jgi:hypothetical protein
MIAPGIRPLLLALTSPQDYLGTDIGHKSFHIPTYINKYNPTHSEIGNKEVKTMYETVSSLRGFCEESAQYFISGTVYCPLLYLV